MRKVENFVEKYFDKYNIPKILHNGKSSILLAVYGCSKVGVSSYYSTKFAKQWLPEKPKYVRLYTYILSIYNKRYCSSCGDIKDIKDFHKNKARKDGLESTCKMCRGIISKTWAENNKAKRNNIAAKYRAENRNTHWSDLDSIYFFYECCPEGCVVDHIIPLKGWKISGLHIETNLQWVTKEYNIMKGSNFND